MDTSKPVDLPPTETKPGVYSMVDTQGAAERSVLPPELVQTLEASLPKLKSARALEALRAVPQSRLARQVLCVEQGVEEATSLILRAYREAAWREITVHTPRNDTERRSFTAVSDSFRLSGSAFMGSFQNCDKSEGFTRVSLSFHETQDATKPVPGTPGAQTKTQPATLSNPPPKLRTKKSRPPAR